MLKGKLIQLLNSLEVQELKRLDKYIQSPFFNKNKKTINLFAYLKKKHPNYEEIDKEKLFKVIFPEKTSYNDALLRALMAELSKLIEGFITYIEYEKKQDGCDLLHAFLDRQLYELFKKQGQGILKKQAKAIVKDGSYFFQKFQLEQLHYQHITITNHRSQETYLQAAIHSLDTHYIATKLRFMWIALNRQQVVGQPYDLGYFSDSFLAQIPPQLLEEQPLIKANYQLVLLLNNLDNTSHFFILKEHLYKYSDCFSNDELRQLYIVMINYCARKFRLGQLNFAEEALELYKAMLESKLLYVKSYIWYQNFINIVNISIAAQAFDWAETFIRKYEKDLHPTYRTYVSLYNMASVYSAQGDYDKTLDTLQQLQFSNFNFDNIDYTHYLNYKTLLIKTYYESEEWLSLESTLEAFRMYLRKNKAVPPHKRKAYDNYIKLVKKLMNKRLGKKRTAKNLLADIEQIPSVMARRWLLMKAKELEN